MKRDSIGSQLCSLRAVASTLTKSSALLFALAIALAAISTATAGNTAPARTLDLGGELRIVGRGDTDSEMPPSCPLEHTDVEADLSGFVADVRVRQTFHNPTNRKVEAVYVFPLPHEAAVGDLVMTIGERRISSRVKRRDAARAAYDQAREAGHVAALLDQERPNVFTQSVANIEPGQKVVIEIRYLQILEYDESDYEFAFPMVVGPRFMPGTPVGKQGTGWSPDTSEVPDASRISPAVAPPATRAGHDIGVTVRIDTGNRELLELDSELHEIDVERPALGRAIVRLARGRTIPNRDFILRYRTVTDAIGDTLLVHDDERGRFFTLLLEPPARVAPEQAVAKELIFVIDRSGSMNGYPIEKARKAMKLAVERMNPRDTFNLMSFGSGVERLFEESVANTAAHRAVALEYLARLSAGGGTQMLPAIEAALETADDPKRLRIVAFMTDGYVGNDLEIIDAVRDHAGTARVFSFGIGNSVNRFLLDGMARAGRGDVEYVTLSSDADASVERFVSRVDAPVLTDIELDWGDLDVESVHPRAYPDLFGHEPIMIHGRLGRKASGTIVLRGNTGQGAFERRIEVQPAGRSQARAALPTLWARAAVDDVTMEHYAALQQQKFPDEAREEVERLGIEYRIATPFTSFVAIDESRITDGDDADTIVVPVEMPDGVSYEGVFGVGGISPPALAYGLMRRTMTLSANSAAPASIARSQAQYAASAPTVGRGKSGHRVLAAAPSRKEPVADGDVARESSESHEKLAKVLRKLADTVADQGKDGSFEIDGVKVEEYRVELIVYLRDTSATTLEALEKLGFDRRTVSGPMRLVVGAIDVRRLDELAASSDVVRIEPASELRSR